MALPRRSGVIAGSASPIPSSGYADVSELDKYQSVSNIGKGSFGVISKVKRLEDGREFALKQLDYSKMTDKDRKQILAEVAISESLKHRNIVQSIQKIKDPKNERIYILMEYCTSGDLGSLIRKAQRTGVPIHEDKIWNIFLQITLALHHCHWPNDRPTTSHARQSISPQSADAPRFQVLHRDLKPENVFSSNEFVKLGDFGLSKDMGNSAFTSTYVGTPSYMPPEILSENRYDTKSDIWSLGCLVFEMCALASPFSTAQTQAELITMVKSGKLPPLPAHISPGLRNVIRAMSNSNPTKRPTTKDSSDMDEMKLHRKLFTVQNQASLLMTKKEEMKQLEERSTARVVALDEREKALALREANLEAREAASAVREEENRETQRRLNAAAEQLRGHWDRLREEKDREKEQLAPDGLDISDQEGVSRRSLSGNSRGQPENRVAPAPGMPRFLRHPAYEDTPSKIPVSIAATFPAPLERLPSAAQATPLRRAATKSLGNLAAAYRNDATPAKQTIALMARQRTSIGSPSEIQKNFCEDVSMASPAPSSIASPATFIPRPRRSSIAPGNGFGRPGSMPSVSTTSDSVSATDQENSNAPVPPTMIPAPTHTFVYREAATPAKWALEDPDSPSPFLRRFPTAPPAQSSQERQPLGSIAVQPASTHPAPSAATSKATRPLIPRSRSGGLHQHVLKANAHARTSGDGVRPRSTATAFVNGTSRKPVG